MSSIHRKELARWLDDLLEPWQYKDYCPNGLQLQGRTDIKTIITGVTASQALIDVAIEKDADAILVHHGWFWKNEDPCIVGMKQRRIAAALAHGLNVFAYHLPLDGHPVFGNNTQLGLQLGFELDRDAEGELVRTGPHNLIQLGRLKEPQTLAQVAAHTEKVLQRPPHYVGNPQHKIHTVAWCTGGAQGFMPDAIAAQVDLYITGEASEHSYHYAVENETAFMAAGHHATERYGVKALGEHLAEHFGVQVEFIDVDNPF